MDDIEILPIEENDKFTNDRVYSALLIKRDNLIEKLYEGNPEVRDSRLRDIVETDKELSEIRITRDFYDFPNTEEVENHKCFDIEKYKATLLREGQQLFSFAAIAQEFRKIKEDGYFDTYDEAYDCAAKQLTAVGRPTTGEKLNKEYRKAKSRGDIK